MPAMPAPVSVTVPVEGVWRVLLGGSKGNILDATLMTALTTVLGDAGRAPDLKAIVLEGDGAHFSYGSSVQEHLPDAAAGMLSRFHQLLYALVDLPVVTLAAVRGKCFGGGLELITLCDRIFASPDASFGQPEIGLGVFAPVASVALAHRVSQSVAFDLCVTGRIVDAGEALSVGLADEIVDNPSLAALRWVQAHLESRSASSLRFAVRAARAALSSALKIQLPAAERLYLDGLMSTADATEGVRAFLEKRAPVWKNR
jgi:cyclohexa-1,5-dienecarbonyl-CoA hydratase